MMKVRFGKRQVCCINHRLEHLCGGTGMEIFMETYNEDEKYDENGEPIFIDEGRKRYTTGVLREIYDNFEDAGRLLYDVFCKEIKEDKYGNCIKGATLDVSLFNTDGLRHAGYWILEECVGDGSTWYDIMDGYLGWDEYPFKTEREIEDFKYNLQEKVDNIDWGLNRWNYAGYECKGQDNPNGLCNNFPNLFCYACTGYNSHEEMVKELNLRFLGVEK